VQQVKVAGFIKRSANHERIKEEEEELKQLMENNPQDTPDNEPEPDSAEERSFKKRYGDLRRHSQKQQVELQKQIDDLKSQLETTAKQGINLPKTEEELDAWVREYPDVARIVETIAIKKAREQSQELETRLQRINEMAEETAKQKAEAELMRLHPDFAKIRDQDEFHEWVEKQPRWVQSALYDNESDAVSAARAIDLYKADKGITAKRSRQSDRDDSIAAARTVRANNKARVEFESEDGLFYESQVERMSSREYEKNQEAIIAAIRAGKFVYDKTGHAR
jgi:uncharacterized membrane-anchored protein YhcB (DUF1043 family)